MAIKINVNQHVEIQENDVRICNHIFELVIPISVIKEILVKIQENEKLALDKIEKL